MRAALSLALVCAVVVAAKADPLPVKVGQCSITKIKVVETRLEGAPDSGSAVEYVNGGAQVSYDTVLAITHSRKGDVVQLCLTELPKNCPPGDNRGKIYSAKNMRTGGTWELPDSEHSCGGA
ncbi:MAG TPA: hypothetical protein VKS78_10400 [Roseiarcus sp.]|nr:hypothetical protein [Roseiarcus sp.]